MKKGVWKPIEESRMRRPRRGRKRVLNSEQVALARRLYGSGGYNIREIAGIFRVSRMAVWRGLQ